MRWVFLNEPSRMFGRDYRMNLTTIFLQHLVSKGEINLRYKVLLKRTLLFYVISFWILNASHLRGFFNLIIITKVTNYSLIFFLMFIV